MKQLFLNFLALLICLQVFSQKYHGQKIIGYIPVYRQSALVTYDKLTHANLAYLKPNEDGTIIEYGEYAQKNFNKFIEMTERLDVVRTISVGGWGSNMASMSASAENIARFTDTLVKFCDEYNFKAVDFDWALVEGETQSQQYGQLIDSLDKHLTEADIELSLVLTSSDWYGRWIPESALEKVDWINVMAYDATGTWAASPYGNHSSYNHMLEGESYWVGRGVDKSKIAIGLPFYGRKFESESGGNAKAVDYKSIVARYPNLSDDMNKTPGVDLTFYNGPDLIKKKCQYVIDNKLNGVAIWEMSQDASAHKSLLKHIICTYDDEVACPVRETCEPVDLEDGLKAHFELDGNVEEASGLEMKETDVTAELTYDRFAENDKAYFFDTSSYVALFAENEIFDVQEHTFSMWVNLKQDTSDIQRIFTKWDDENNNNSYVIYTWDEKISIQYFRGEEAEPKKPYYNSSVKLAKNEWYHVAVSHSYDDGTKIYLDGLLICQNSDQFTIQQQLGDPLVLGGSEFRRKLDDIKIYDRVLSQCEIDGLFYDHYANEKVVCKNIMTETGCSEITVNGETYSKTGLYQKSIDQGADCDSLVILELTIKENPVKYRAFNQTDNVLTSFIEGYDYQWFNCTTSQIVEGETNQDFSITASGEYALQVSDETCTFTSPCKEIDVVASLSNAEEQLYKLYPNPAHNVIDIEGQGIRSVAVYNTLGNLMLVTTDSKVNLEGYSSGLYTVIIELENEEKISKKLLIE